MYFKLAMMTWILFITFRNVNTNNLSKVPQDVLEYSLQFLSAKEQSGARSISSNFKRIVDDKGDQVIVDMESIIEKNSNDQAAAIPKHTNTFGELFLLNKPAVLRAAYMNGSSTSSMEKRTISLKFPNNPVSDQWENESFPIQMLRLVSNSLIGTVCKNQTVFNDIFRFVYNYCYEFARKQNDSLLPEMEAMYYLLENSRQFPHKLKQFEYLNYLQNVVRVDFWHHSFIRKEWSCGHLTEYTKEIGVVIQLLKEQFPEGSLEFIHHLMFDLYIKLLDGGHYNLMDYAEDEVMLKVFPALISAASQVGEYDVLYQLLMCLKRSNGLFIVGNNTGIIPELINDLDGTELVDVFAVLIRVISEEELPQQTIDVFAMSLGWWFGTGDMSSTLAELDELAKDGYFNKNMLSIICKMHTTYFFDQEQILIFRKMIQRLITLRPEWRNLALNCWD